jgi:hypothetical protein
MIRTSAPTWLAFGLSTLVTLVSSTGAAEPTSTTTTDPEGTPAITGQRIGVPTPQEAFVTVPHAAASQVLYLNRCTGGCTVNGGGLNDARSNTSTIPNPGTYTIAEFAGNGGTTGNQADADWATVLACVKEVYSPFDIQVTDVRPTAGLSYHMAIVGGTSASINLGNASILGIAPSSCTPQDNVISFSFANAHPGTTVSRLLDICATVAQESAHSYGLPNHSWEFTSGRSACNDAMTYRTDCGGQKFFRNEQATCGDFVENDPPCQCGSTQNSHLKLQSVFGAGTSTVPPPTATVTLPLPNTGLGAVAGVQAGSKRGVAKVELLINGYKWAEVPGVEFGVNGQPNPAPYTLTVPPAVPSSKLRVVARAYDDLGTYSDSAPVEAYKGAPGGCVDASTCAAGQRCDAGYCLWDPPAGAIGDDCTYDQFCVSGMCRGTADQQICTQSCIPGTSDSCPQDLTCIASGPGSGVCFFPADDGGCCSVGDDRSALFQAGLGLGLLGLILVRPRRRRR